MYALLFGLGAANVVAQLGPLSDRAQAPQARSQAELDSYLDILTAKAPSKVILAVNRFADAYPSSELLGVAWQYQVHAYEQSGQFQSMLLAGEKALSANPDNLNTLLTLAPAIANRVSQHPGDLALLSRGEGYARQALHAIDKTRPPRQTPLDRWEQQKAEMERQAHEALGVLAFTKGDAAAAVREFDAVLQLSPMPGGDAFFRLGAALLAAGRRAEAKTAFTKAASLGPAAVAELANAELRKLDAAPANR